MNIADALHRQAAARPQQNAVLEPDSRGGYRYLTFGELWDRVARIAAALLRHGITPGTRTVLMVPPSMAFVELTFALFAARAVPVFVDPGIGLKHLKTCLAEAEPAAFVGITKAHVARLLFGWAKSSLKSLVTVGPRLLWGGTTLDRLRQAPASDVGESLSATRSDDVAAILFTSGSTGVPKGAVYTHGMFNAQLESLRYVFGIEPGEVDLCTFPLFALFGPALGMTSVIPEMDSTKPALVEPRNITGPAFRLAATNLFGSPALINRVSRHAFGAPGNVRHPGDSNDALRSLKRVLSAGAPVSPAILERFANLLSPGTQIFTPYGATEALPVAVIGSDEVLRDTQHLTAQGAGTCVGKPVPGIEVRIIRISDEPIATMSPDLSLLPGEIGEIAVYGPQVTQEYFRRPDLTALAKIADPEHGRVWHRMGDLGYFDDQGRLWFCGRKSQRVVTPERTYFTDPVEGVFNTHPAVFRSAIVGVTRNDAVEPVLCIELEQSAKLQATAEITHELLARGQQHEHTRAIRTVLYHPAFPVDIRHNSKIFREKLAVWADQQLQS